MLVFWRARVNSNTERQVIYGVHHDEAKDCDDGHEYAGALAKGQSIDLNKWLRGVECKKRIEVGCAEQEQDCGGEP